MVANPSPNGSTGPGAHQRGAPQALAPRHPGGRKVARAGLRGLAQLLCRSGVEPVHPCVPPQAATPVDASVTPPVPASSFQLEASGAHDRNLMVMRVHPPPMAGPAVCRQSPEVGAGWFSDHVRICAGGAQQCTFLPRSCDLQVMSLLPYNRLPFSTAASCMLKE